VMEMLCSRQPQKNRAPTFMAELLPSVERGQKRVPRGLQLPASLDVRLASRSRFVIVALQIRSRALYGSHCQQLRLHFRLPASR
jgi:hypothetical protein